MPAPADFQQRLQSIERLVGEIDSSADPSLRASVQQLVQLVMDLHGAGIERMLELIRSADSESIVQKLGQDDLVASLLVLYGLHPLSLEERVVQALGKVRLRLKAREGDVEVLRADGHGCGSTGQALKEMVEEAVYQAAPDLTELTIEGGETPSFVPLAALQGAGQGAALAEKGGM